MSLRLVPCGWSDARAFCTSWHRHHPKPPPGHKFIVACAAGTELVGVGIVGRCTARGFDDHALAMDATTLEITRTVTDGYRNANSMLNGAAARAAFALGYIRVVTYTQSDESGASLRAAGFTIVAERPARPGWDTPSRPRADHGLDQVPRTLWERTA